MRTRRKKRFRSLLVTSAALVIFIALSFITALGLFTSQYGWTLSLEVFSHFQLQYLIVSLFLLTLLTLTRRRFLILVGLFCCAAISVQIVPWYLPLAPQQSSSPGDLRILLANVNSQNQQYERVLALVRRERPDLAVFMEVDDTWVERLNTLQTNLLPYSSGPTNSQNLGLIVYSRYRLDNTEIKRFDTETNSSIVGQFNFGATAIAFTAIHPPPPAKESLFHSRNRQRDLVGKYVQTLSKPVLVLGDFNTTMWSPYYRRFIRQTGLKNTRRGFGVLPSWPTKGSYVPGLSRFPDWMPLLLSIPIDHCLTSAEFQAANIRTGPNIGSDHHPVIVDLTFVN